MPRDCLPRAGRFILAAMRTLFPSPSLLLLGPTGAGKSPLGDELERVGLAGRPCAHFDFGRELRRAEADTGFARRRALAEGERAEIVRVLCEGALLERDSFSIALKLLDGFTAERAAGGAAWLVMNGLPRHLEQAEALASRLRVDAVIHLDCDAATALERIRRDAGGDRTGRADDALDAVRRRLEIYCARTAPLVAYYTARGARHIIIPVGPTTTAAEAAAQVAAALA
mgnify:CR=1 FL=1